MSIEIHRELYFDFFKEKNKSYRILNNETKKIVAQGKIAKEDFIRYTQEPNTSFFILQYEVPEAANHFFIDIDYKLNPNFDILKSIPAFNMYCSTGGGYHLYWKLEKTVSGLDACKVGKYIAKLVNADHKCNNVSRVLRAGGTLTKNNEVVTVKNKNRVLEHSLFEHLLKNASQYEEDTTEYTGIDEDLTSTEIKVTRFKKIPIEYRDIILNGPSDTYLLKFSNDLSSFDWHIIKALKDFGYTKEEIKWVYTNDKFGITKNNQRKANFQYYINRTINRAFS